MGQNILLLLIGSAEYCFNEQQQQKNNQLTYQQGFIFAFICACVCVGVLRNSIGGVDALKQK